MSRYKCIVWDWNGTLFDDLDICISVMNKILKVRNLPLLDTERYKGIFCFPIKQYYRHLGFDFDKESFEKLSIEYISEYQRKSLSAKLNKHCISVLEYIKNMGIKQVILSASQVDNLIEQVRHFCILHYFDKLIGLDNCHAASKAEIGIRWFKESGYSCDEVLLIGDTLHDYEISCEIGCDCVLVSCGHQSRERFLHHNVQVIDSLMEVKELIVNLEGRN